MKLKNINSQLIFFTIVFSLFFITSNSAQALTLSPARIEVSGDPGTTITKEITLLNDSLVGEETYYVSYSNFEAQGETGSPLFVEPKNDLGTWMTTVEQITLAANESRKINLNINIPNDAYSGGHFAVVFFGNNPATGEGAQVSVGAKTGTLVLLTVSGQVLEAGGLSSFTTETAKDKLGEIIKNKKGNVKHKFFYNSLPVGLEYRWKNDGDDRVKPSGEVTIRNMFYIPVTHIDANSVSGNILPHSTRLFNIEWKKIAQGDPLNNNKKDDIKKPFIKEFFNKVDYQWKHFALGIYIANLDLTYGSENIHSSKNAYFAVLPWQLLIVLFIIFVILYLILKVMLKKYNQHIIKMARLGFDKPSSVDNA